MNAVRAAQQRGENPFPHKFETTVQLPAYVERYSGLEAGEQLSEVEVRLAGRVERKAASGPKLAFLELRSLGSKLQIMADARNFAGGVEAFQAALNAVKRGDIVGVVGFPGKSKKGELSVFASEVRVLTPCLHMAPGRRTGLKDQVRPCFIVVWIVAVVMGGVCGMVEEGGV